MERADVVVHNMRGMSARALGISYQQLQQIKPDWFTAGRRVFASVGPDAENRMAMDIIQARSGMAALNTDSSGTSILPERGVR